MSTRLCRVDERQERGVRLDRRAVEERHRLDRPGAA
jgi:hypothetical protein